MCDPVSALVFTVLFYAGVVGTAYAATTIAQKGQPEPPELPPLPDIHPATTELLEDFPDPEEIKRDAREEARRRQRLRRGQRILTSPVGLIDEPNLAVKTLLGG